MLKEKKIENIHIFILTSPIGIENAEKVIHKYLKPNEKTILFKDSLYNNFEPKYWSEVININNFISFNKIKTGQNRKKILKIIESKFQNFKKYHFYVMDYDALTNYIVNFFLCEEKEVSIIEDGIVNYINSYPENQNIFKQFLKLLFYKLLGINTKMYFGTCTGIETDEIRFQFLKFPGLSQLPQKTLSIDFNSIDYFPRSDVVLILGQTMENRNESIYRLQLKKMIEKIITQHGYKTKRIMYKPHRWEKWLISDLLHEYNIILINDISPIESIIHEIQPKFIYSFGSSALINIAMCINQRNSVEIYAYPYLEYEIYKPLIPLFEKAGVIVI